MAAQESPELLRKEVALLYHLAPELDRVVAWYARRVVRAVECKKRHLIHPFIKEARWRLTGRTFVPSSVPENREVTEADLDDYGECVNYQLRFWVELGLSSVGPVEIERHTDTVFLSLTNTSVHINDDLSVPIDIPWLAVVESIVEEIINSPMTWGEEQ